MVVLLAVLVVEVSSPAIADSVPVPLRIRVVGVSVDAFLVLAIAEPILRKGFKGRVMLLVAGIFPRVSVLVKAFILFREVVELILDFLGAVLENIVVLIIRLLVIWGKHKIKVVLC